MKPAWNWDRFERHTKRNEKTGCLEWQLCRNKDGYGRVMSQQTNSAHRLAYLLTKGSIPPGMCVCHSCDNRACVEPQHLHLGTHDDNMRDMVVRGRHVPKPGVLNGQSKLNDQTVVEIRRHHREGASQSALAKQFGVCQATISYVVRGVRWKHLMDA